MLSESLLDWPMVHTIGAAASKWHLRENDNSSARDDRNAIIAIQWFVAIATSYLIVAEQDGGLVDSLAALLVSLCLISAIIVQRIPHQYFNRRVIEPALLVVDSILIVSALILPQQVPWDLLLLFFFCVFIAATGDSLFQIAAGCVLLSLVFLIFFSPYSKDLSTIEAHFLIRVPFMFGISVVYGHLAGQIKREKRRMENLEGTMQLKRQLVCALAHDIKTPLNIILGHAELLAGEYAGMRQPTPTERLSSITCIRNNIESVVRLITEFLDVSKLETVKSNAAKELVQINAIAEDVVLQQMVTAREKNLKLSVDLEQPLKPVVGEHQQLQRALWNLLSNAIKFTPADGSITVSTRMVKKYISIQVADTGAGIPKEELSSLFSEFKRLKGAANIEGTGLGLFIVKTIVEAHQGSVTVESTEGVGATFTILIPAAKEVLE